MSEIYEVNQASNDSRFAISDFTSKVGEVKYLDEVRVAETPKKVQNEDLNFNLFGGAAKSKKPKKANEEKVIYPSLNDIPDKSIKEFLNVCHIDYITSNHKSNSIFVIPDDKALAAIKEDINSSLGKTKPDSPEAVLKIKSAPKLLYKLFILDTFGKNDNLGFSYRIPLTYPNEFDPSIIYRRTTHYEEKAFFIQLTKNGCKVSNESDMSNPITLTFVDVIGRYPNYISFVFKGNLLPLMNKTKSANAKPKKNKKSIKRRFHELMKANEYDNEAGAYQFVGEMIDAYGVEKCRPYYSANFLQSALSMIAAFGETASCGNPECDCNKAHLSMMKAYKPKVRALLTSQNINKISEYGNRYVASMNSYLSDNDYAKSQSYSSDRYFKQIKNAYKQIANDVRSDNEINNVIAADVGYGIYENTNNVDLTIEMMNLTKSCLNGTKKMNSNQLSNAINIMSDYAFHGLNAAQYYPLVNLSKSANTEMTGGDADKEDDLELKIEGECNCGKCPECLSKKVEQEPTTIDDMEKLDELI